MDINTKVYRDDSAILFFLKVENGLAVVLELQGTNKYGVYSIIAHPGSSPFSFLRNFSQVVKDYTGSCSLN